MPAIEIGIFAAEIIDDRFVFVQIPATKLGVFGRALLSDARFFVRLFISRRKTLVDFSFFRFLVIVEEKRSVIRRSNGFQQFFVRRSFPADERFRR